MLHTLHGKLAVTLLLLLCVVALLTIPLIASTTQRYLEETNQKLNRPLAAHVAESLDANAIVHPDAHSLDQTIGKFKKIMAINPDVEVYLLDTTGRILAFSPRPAKSEAKQLPFPLFADFSANPILFLLLAMIRVIRARRKYFPQPRSPRKPSRNSKSKDMYTSFWAGRNTIQPRRWCSRVTFLGLPSLSSPERCCACS